MSLWLGRHLLLYLPTSLDTSGLGGWVLPILAIALAVGGGGHSLPLQSRDNGRLLAVGRPGEPDSIHLPRNAQGSLISALGLEQRQGDARHRPNGSFAHLVKAGRRMTGVPKVTRTRYPPSRSAKPRRSACLESGFGRHRRLQPVARAEGFKAGGVALWKSTRGSPEERRTPAPASLSGLPGVPGRVLCTVLPIAASGRGVGGGALRTHGG
uniref:Uncharacterized protein LOC123613409 n=1 Tax=Camelus bactrianus TaxID=9837 RepID=A0A9W3FP32_CAMBA|nr:uncharacterized protein LOC123613409 [Camelus bactrianus]